MGDSSSDTPSAIERRFDGLTVWKRGEQRAPHKPLLVLYALGQMAQGVRWVPFRQVDEALGRLLVEFGPPRKRHRPEYPFWRLQNDGVWSVRHEGALTQLTASDDPLKSELKGNNVPGGFSDDVWAALQEDDDLRRRVAQRMLDEHFPASSHDDILTAVGLAGVLEAVHRRRRDPNFRKEVLQAYSYRCAVCGFDLKVGLAPVGLEAAHIQWHQARGPDEVRNGVALCALHHKLLDRGAIHVTAGLRLLVSEAVHGSDPHLGRLRGRHGQPIHAPQRTQYRPKASYVRWHVREVFRGPAEARP